MKKETLTPENDFLMIDYQGLRKQVNLENEDYICLNDLLEFFPNRRIYDWQILKTTKEYVNVVNKFLQSEHENSRVHSKSWLMSSQTIKRKSYKDYDPSYVRDHN